MNFEDNIFFSTVIGAIKQPNIRVTGADIKKLFHHQINNLDDILNEILQHRARYKTFYKQDIILLTVNDINLLQNNKQKFYNSILLVKDLRRNSYCYVAVDSCNDINVYNINDIFLKNIEELFLKNITLLPQQNKFNNIRSKIIADVAQQTGYNTFANDINTLMLSCNIQKIIEQSLQDVLGNCDIKEIASAVAHCKEQYLSSVHKTIAEQFANVTNPIWRENARIKINAIVADVAKTILRNSLLQATSDDLGLTFIDYLFSNFNLSNRTNRSIVTTLAELGFLGGSFKKQLKSRAEEDDENYLASHFIADIKSAIAFYTHKKRARSVGGLVSLMKCNLGRVAGIKVTINDIAINSAILLPELPGNTNNLSSNAAWRITLCDGKQEHELKIFLDQSAVVDDRGLSAPTTPSRKRRKVAITPTKHTTPSKFHANCNNKQRVIVCSANINKHLIHSKKPAHRSQNKVFGNVSADPVAQAAGMHASEELQKWHWCHLLAFSFGIKDPQDISNFILATREANAAMTIPEGCIRKLAKDEIQSNRYCVTVKAFLVPGKERYYLAKALEYTISDNNLDRSVTFHMDLTQVSKISKQERDIIPKIIHNFMTKDRYIQSIMPRANTTRELLY